nr:G-type lectin S-receptor-like serine/threonine-protein kinase At4g27290 [Ipomoea batatas]
MEALLLVLLLAFLLSLIPNICLGKDLITKTQFLRDGDTIVSEGGTFVMGFFNPTNSLNRYIGIWYRQDPVKTVVWVANRDAPLADTSSAVLKITLGGQLALLGDKGQAVWSANTSRSVQNQVAELLDSGNLVVRDADDENPENFLWQSFDYPTDNFLPGMKVGWNLQTGHEVFLTAWKSENDPASGQYTLHLDPTGYPQLIVKNGTTVISSTGPWNGVHFSVTSVKQNRSIIGPHGLVINKKEVYYWYSLNKDLGLVRFVVTSDGLFKSIVWEDQINQWMNYRRQPSDTCGNYDLCGGNGVCNIQEFRSCGCLDKFLPNDNATATESLSRGCHRRTPLNCHNNGSSSDGFLKYSDIKLPDTKQSWYNESMSLQECKQVCLRNCSCMAYSTLNISNGGSGCLIWYGDLVDMRTIQDGQDIYIRLAATEIPGPTCTCWRQGSACLVCQHIKIGAKSCCRVVGFWNLVVRDADDEKLQNFVWQSFDHPTDHWLSGMKLGWNLQTGHEVFLTAWKGENDPASGQYTLHLDPTGYPQLSLRNRTTEIFNSGPWNGLRFSVAPVEQSNTNVGPYGLVRNKNEDAIGENP